MYIVQCTLMLYVSVIRLQYNKKISVSLEPIPEKNTVKIVHLWGGEQSKNNLYKHYMFRHTKL